MIHHGKGVPCPACGQRGHKIGNKECAAQPKEKIDAFRGYKHPLSNHYPCQLDIIQATFKSVEHALFWRMLVEMGKTELAKDVKKTKKNPQSMQE